MPERDYLDPNGASVRNAPVVATNEATSLLSRGLPVIGGWDQRGVCASSLISLCDQRSPKFLGVPERSSSVSKRLSAFAHVFQCGTVPRAFARNRFNKSRILICRYSQF